MIFLIAKVYPSFHTIKQLAIFELSSDWGLVHQRIYASPAAFQQQNLYNQELTKLAAVVASCVRFTGPIITPQHFESM